MVLLYVAAVSSVLAAFAWRAARRRLTPTTLRSLTAAAGIAGIALVLGVAALPHTSGTHRAALTAPSAFSDRFTGSLAQRNGTGGSLLSVIGTGTGSRRVLLRIDLLSTDGQSISNTALQLEDVATRTVCQGTVSSMSAAGFKGRCAVTTGTSRSIAAVWRLTGKHLAGTINLRA